MKRHLFGDDAPEVHGVSSQKIESFILESSIGINRRMENLISDLPAFRYQNGEDFGIPGTELRPGKLPLFCVVSSTERNQILYDVGATGSASPDVTWIHREPMTSDD